MWEFVYYSLIFGLFVCGFFLLPGLTLLNWANIKQIANRTKISCGLILGVIGFLWLVLILRSLGLSFRLMWIYAGVGVWFSWKRLIQRKLQLTHFKLNIKKFFYLLVLTTLVLILSILHLTGGVGSDGMHLAAARDGLWRVAVVGELIHHFPPQIPGFPPQLLKNYHFFYDLLVASTQFLTSIPTLTLYFKLFTVFSAALFVLLIYEILALFVNKSGWVLYGTVLTVLTGNLSYLLHFFSAQYSFLYKANIFMSDQPFDQVHNPFNLFAYSLVLLSIYLLFVWERNSSPKTFLLLALVIGLLPGIKIYAGVLVLGAYIGMVAYKIFWQKYFRFYLLLPFIFVLPVLNSIRGSGFSILVFNPGWLLTKMIEDRDRIYWPEMALKLQYYTQTGNIFRILQIRITQLLVYFLGNLNVRVLGLIVLFRRAWYKDQTGTKVFILLIAVFAFGLPLFFSQNRASYDSIQFTPYGLLLISLLLAVVFTSWVLRLKQNLRTAVGWLGGGLLLALAIPTNIFVLNQNLLATHYQVNKDEVAALAYLSKNMRPDEIVLTDLDQDKQMYMYVAALLERRGFLAGIALNETVGINSDPRRKEINQFFANHDENLDQKRNFLHSNTIAYIYISASGLTYRDLLNDLGLQTVYQNQKVYIYKVP